MASLPFECPSGRDISRASAPWAYGIRNFTFPPESQTLCGLKQGKKTGRIETNGRATSAET